MNQEEVALRDSFNTYFQNWKITLPDLDNLEDNEAGKITFSGWWITYRFGRDEKGRWLEFYAQHRMTNDRHMRYHSDGSEVTLPTLDEPVFIPENATPAEEEIISQKARDRYKSLYRELKETGMV